MAPPIRHDPKNTRLHLEVLSNPREINAELTNVLLGQGVLQLAAARNIWMFRPWLELYLFSRIDVTDYMTVGRFMLLKDNQPVWCEYVADMFRYEAQFRPGADVNLHSFRQGSLMAGSWTIEVAINYLPPLAWQSLAKANQHLVFDQIPFAQLARVNWQIFEPSELTPTGERVRPLDPQVFSNRDVSADEI